MPGANPRPALDRHPAPGRARAVAGRERSRDRRFHYSRELPRLRIDLEGWRPVRAEGAFAAHSDRTAAPRPRAIRRRHASAPRREEGSPGS